MSVGADELVLSYMAMTRVEPPWHFVRGSWQDRCTAAAAGGFAAIGIVPDVYDEARAAGHSDGDLKAMLREAGVVVGELEGVALYGPSGRDTTTEALDRALAVAELFGVGRLFVTSTPGVSEQDLADAFGWVCDRCQGQGLLVGIEFMDIPSLSSLPDAPSALAVVQAAGRDNGGLVIDSYHHVNGPNDWSHLEALPGELIVGIQLDDSAIPRVVDDYLEDTLHHRRAPGEGDADLVRFVRTMDAIGAACPYSIEVISDEIMQLPPAELGTRLGSTSRQVIATARSGSIAPR